MELEGSKDGEELGVAEVETGIRIYYVRKKNMFSKNKKISNESKVNERKDAHMTTPEGLDNLSFNSIYSMQCFI